MSEVKLTAGQRGLVRIIAANIHNRSISRREIKQKGLRRQFAAARRARLIISAEYETSVRGDEFLASPAGRRALEKEGAT